MTSLPRILSITAGFLLLLSCNNDQQALKSRPKETTILNIAALDTVEVYNTPDGFDAVAYRKKPFRLYTSINVSCASCIAKVNTWDSIYRSMGETPQLALIPVAQTEDNFEVFKYLFENGTIKSVEIPFFMDGNNEFRNSNRQLIGNQFDFLLLTDSTNKVLAFEDRSDDAKQIRKLIALTQKNE
ncbi:MAG: hypothetical protein DI535_26140 [Citrobacter freundii]|nr:MAG: hypothetical protein DI535_26140 [Citrobacter freundii]